VWANIANAEFIVRAVNVHDLMREALEGAAEFLKHSGNQRAVLSGKFTTPSARYAWFQRTKAKIAAALAAAEGRA
jgi:hypothetical protein